MARGGMPPRPPAGGRGQPPRRGGQPPKKAGQPPQKQGQKPAQKQGMTQAQKAAQTRHLVEQQRRNAAQKTAQQQQHRQKQARFLREAHTQRRRAAAEQRNAQLQEQLSRLESILVEGLSRSPAIDLDSLYQTPEPGPPFDPGQLGVPNPEPAWEDFAPAGGLLGSIEGLSGGRAGRERREQAAREAYEQAREQWEEAERQRAEQLAAAQYAHDEAVSARHEQIEQYNSRIARVAAGLRTREPAVVASFLRTVLQRTPLPEDFPRRFEVQHEPDTEWARVRWVLPGPAVVPPVSRYEYLAGVDEVKVVPRPETESKELYQSVIAQVALLVVRDLLDSESQLAGVSLEGLADRLDPETGSPAFACLLRMDVDRPGFAELDLYRTAPQAALRQLSASRSADPWSLEPLPDAA